MGLILRILFFVFIVRPIVKLLIGLNVRRPEALPQTGPLIIAANHNSHLDAVTIVSLFPIYMIPKIRPVAASDYFLKNRLMAWFSTNVIGIIPVTRGRLSHRQDPLAPIEAALKKGEIVIIFPEGSRGEPERMSQLKSGIAHLAKRFPDVPTLPIFLHGLGKVLPRNERLFVPLFCDVIVGDKIYWNGSKNDYMNQLEDSLYKLSHERKLPEWN